ncbi:hypothetical protein E6W26_28955 [Pseudomonas aeruginosa]|uniref:hypothetical protein n=1 Tax=Pseudomonas aeruginosa TaxID=287 RepID=UPI00109DAFD4|nr:hypothetical protein [Pseudomonas aeruginosa]EKV1241297.1 hypothetical protein [Pseudomonas aeruginosa]EKV8586206.1 hypothetical protein [Pseudomonas aeruginosa]ELN5407424.1 hypothetical protein [Pseudomonas aeruginosa]ELP1438615.1 hypothetical protein [Pseudomonas aeruginosa]THB16429.1 hypothetical protein E6W26_28955 [Pseudomonas aeruginosa]
MCNYKYNIESNLFEETLDLSIPELNIVITTSANAIAKLEDYQAKLAVEIAKAQPFKTITMSLNELWSYTQYKKLVVASECCNIAIAKLMEIPAGELVAMTDSLDEDIRIFVMDEYQQAMYHQFIN